MVEITVSNLGRSIRQQTGKTSGAMGAQILPMTLKFRQPFQPSGEQVRAVGVNFT